MFNKQKQIVHNCKRFSQKFHMNLIFVQTRKNTAWFVNFLKNGVRTCVGGDLNPTRTRKFFLQKNDVIREFSICSNKFCRKKIKTQSVNWIFIKNCQNFLKISYKAGHPILTLFLLGTPLSKVMHYRNFLKKFFVKLFK